MRAINITSEVRCWIRDPQGKWYSVNTEDAVFVLDAPKGGYAKLRKRGRQKKDREVAQLIAMPREYKKSDLSLGVGATLWTWDLGARTCAQVRHQIDSRIREDLDRAQMFGNKVPRYVPLYQAMRDRLCEGREDNPRSGRMPALRKKRSKKKTLKRKCNPISVRKLVNQAMK